MSLWSFSSSVSAERQQLLLGCDSFDTIEACLVLAADVAKFVWEPYRDQELAGCSRAAFKLSVAPHLYDLFFNATVGYRAQYAVGIDQGEAANRRLLESLMSSLVAASSGRCSESYVRASLQAQQAKVWIHEKEVEEHLAGEEQEILFPQWQGHCETEVGLRAPVGTELVVYGGWLGKNGSEKLNPLKLLRSKQIHECGFS